MKTNEKGSVLEREQHKRAAEERRRQIVEELSFLRVRQLEMEAGDAKVRLASFLNQHGGEGQVPPRRQGDLRKLQENVEIASTAYRSEKDKQDRLTAELTDLKVQLAAFEFLCSEEEILAHQKDLEEAENQVARLKAVIAEEEKAAEGAGAAVPTMGDLLERRQNLLAEIATGGEDAKAELQALEVEIKGREKEIVQAKERAAKISDRARETIAGLKRKLTAAEGRVEALKREVIPAALTHFIMNRAEIAAQQYIEMGRELVNMHLQILGLGSILKTLPEGKDLARNYAWNHFKIPGFYLKACEAIPLGSFGEVLTFDPGPGGIEQAAQVEREKIRGLGITL